MDINRIKDFNFFVKGDISGIQDFIFNVKSERAAKTLKARSFFIVMAAKAALKLMATQKQIQVEKFYEGGGNFYAFVKAKDESQLQTLQTTIAQAFQKQGLYLTLSFVNFQYTRDIESFGQLWATLDQKSHRNKMEQFKFVPSAFFPFKTQEIHKITTKGNIATDLSKKNLSEADAWRNLTDVLVKSKGFIWKSDNHQEPFLHPDGVSLFGQKLELARQGMELSNNILNKLPQWNQSIRKQYDLAIERVRMDYADSPPENKPEDNLDDHRLISFEYLSAFAGQRNGSTKLGILKLDVDNLGREFEKKGGIKEKKALSEYLDEFFNKRLFNLMQEVFAYHGGKDQYSHNLYTIFAGGDDCFFIGGWDAMFELARDIRAAFTDFLQENNLPKLTLSAALLVVDDKFPVVRFAELAEEALHTAKYHRYNLEEPTKNKISIFGEVLTWEEFEKARDYALRLETLIRVHKRPKSLLNRLKNIGAGYDRFYRQVEEMHWLNATQVNQMAFYLGKLRIDRSGSFGGDQVARQAADQAAFQLTKEILHECQKTLILSFTGSGKSVQSLNPMVFPVAARWAELLCRNTKSE